MSFASRSDFSSMASAGFEQVATVVIPETVTQDGPLARLAMRSSSGENRATGGLDCARFSARLGVPGYPANVSPDENASVCPVESLCAYVHGGKRDAQC